MFVPLAVTVLAVSGPPESLSPILVRPDGRAIPSKGEWQLGRLRLRERWLLFLGPLPGKRAPLKTEVLEVEELPGFTRKHIRYQIEPGVTTDGYLLLPKGQTGKRPGVVVFHQTVATHAKQ